MALELAALAHLLFAIGQDDAVVVLSVLEIILGQNPIAGRQRVAGQRDVLLGDVGGRTAHLHVRSRAFETARQRVLRFAVVVAAIVIVVVATAAATILLSLPHGLPFTLRWFVVCPVSHLDGYSL